MVFRSRDCARIMMKPSSLRPLQHGRHTTSASRHFQCTASAKHRAGKGARMDQRAPPPVWLLGPETDPGHNCARCLRGHVGGNPHVSARRTRCEESGSYSRIRLTASESSALGREMSHATRHRKRLAGDSTTNSDAAARSPPLTVEDRKLGRAGARDRRIPTRARRDVTWHAPARHGDAHTAPVREDKLARRPSGGHAAEDVADAAEHLHRCEATFPDRVRQIRRP